MKQAQKFLSKKEQVRVMVLLKGRERSRADKAAEILNQLYEEYLTAHGKCTKPATPQNPTLTIMPLGNNS